MFANTYSAQKLFSLFEAIYSGMSASDAESHRRRRAVRKYSPCTLGAICYSFLVKVSGNMSVIITVTYFEI